MTSQTDIAANIRDIRKSLNLSQSDVADYLGIKWASYQRLESKGGFKLEQISLLAELFNVSQNFIINGTDYDTSIQVAYDNETNFSRASDVTTIVQDPSGDEANRQHLINILKSMDNSDRNALLKLLNNDSDK